METTHIINVVSFSVLFFCLLTITIEYVVSSRRQRRLANARSREREHLEVTRRNTTDHMRRKLTRQAIELLLANGYVTEGIALASMVGTTEVPVDRELRPNRPRRRPNLVTVADGSRMSISRVVQRARANGQAPDAPPGPVLMELLEKLQQQMQRENESQPFSGPVHTPVEELVVRLVKLEGDAKGLEKPSAADETYGKPVEYTINPANSSIWYVGNNCW
ncbi:uncharacterized protein TEOVI_000350700 [Trypanosoma equiperdum]|uniref:Uncharacterized protein n=2 Tax=Trypanozoon TaxID=39700 RepID=Q57V90_TRYB2|nr:hypothetical protein, conserved [Trypanosoma brucei brucei TREU927]AAX70495.1 hypothetical protein, conserved [Trypanosoma brucei]AAZ13532.1 hypothetical protein, conserved [Trypanosoma brucei brucei TREU927]SCU71925.1 hypothetical protein, conserved [Trypanosoma equiperdum]